MKRIWEVKGGNGCTITWMYLTPQKCTFFKRAEVIYFMSHVLNYNLKTTAETNIIVEDHFCCCCCCCGFALAREQKMSVLWAHAAETYFCGNDHNTGPDASPRGSQVWGNPTPALSLVLFTQDEIISVRDTLRCWGQNAFLHLDVIYVLEHQLARTVKQGLLVTVSRVVQDDHPSW